MVVIINHNDEHNVVGPVPVSDDIMVMGPAYKIKGLTMSTTHWHQCLSCSGDIMAVEPAYQLSPYVSPQQATSANPLKFQTQQAAVWPADPLHGFSNPASSHLQADNMPSVVISHIGPHTSIFFNDPLESCPY